MAEEELECGKMTTAVRIRVPLLLATLVLCYSASADVWAQRRSVAITFDDLPVAGTIDPVEARSITLSILKSLDRHHVPAIGFVIGKTARDIGDSEGKELLGEWVRHGYDLGNHTFSHVIFDNLTIAEFEQEVVAGEASLAPVLASVGKTPRYFGFPENHTGDTKEKHDAMAAFLAQRGYRLAVTTIDNEDFVFNWAYVRMLSNKDQASAAKLRAAYLAYTSTEIDYYAGLHKQVFGREIPHVMLLHVNRLNADLIDKVLELFERKQYRFVTLDAAMSDAAFETHDEFVTKNGWMWGYRWAKELNVRVNGSLESEPPAWVRQYVNAQK
jgi:peptidoglycan/xylan/chitin deacetylase (PgdA/CDA1 family)